MKGDLALPRDATNAVTIDWRTLVPNFPTGELAVPWHDRDVPLSDSTGASELALFLDSELRAFSGYLRQSLIEGLFELLPLRLLETHPSHASATVRPSPHERLDSVKEALSNSPFEPGMEHPADRPLHAAMLEGRLGLLLSSLGEDVSPDELATLLRCIGRMPASSDSLAFDFVRHSLEHASVIVRGASIRALESWSTRQSLDVLAKHTDSNVRLMRYIHRVIGSKDLA